MRLPLHGSRLAQPPRAPATAAAGATASDTVGATARAPASSAQGVAWDLADLYAGPDDPAIAADQQAALAAAEAFAAAYRGRVGGLDAALKNVIAIACGVSDGLGFGDNAKAALVTRGLAEILRLGLALGARAETFYGLAGVGDLVVTCMSRHSRNWKFGSLLGQGRSAEQALAEVGMVVEGYTTVQAAVGLARKMAVEMPITEAVAAVLFQGLAPLQAVGGLMLRGARGE